MRRKINKISMIFAGIALFAQPATAQVKNADAFEQINQMYRELRASEPENCCEFTTSLFGRSIRFWLFDNFLPVYQAQNREMFIMEFVPEGETVNNWSRMITVQSFLNFGTLPISTEDLQKRMFGKMRQCSPDRHFSEILQSGKFGDGTDYVLSSNGCGMGVSSKTESAAARKPQQFLALIFRDSLNVQIIQYAETSEAFMPQTRPIDNAEAMVRMAKFRDILVCVAGTNETECKINFSAMPGSSTK